MAQYPSQPRRELRQPRHRRRRRGGFTLLEIVVVVTIIALLAALVAPRLLDNVGRAKDRIAQSEVASIAQQVNLYLLDNGFSSVPNDFSLELLTEGDKPYLRDKDLMDPWGNPYVIVVPGDVNPDFDIVSYGADGMKDGEGDNADITN